MESHHLDNHSLVSQTTPPLHYPPPTTMSSLLTTENPVFVSYALCVTVLSIKMSFIAWNTVYHMVNSGGKGIRNPEDLIAGPCNPEPHPDDLKPYPPTE
eukprot:10239299-Ditylum_brightwellii.AAC.1